MTGPVVTTSYSAIKAALVTLLTPRLNGVDVAYGMPEKAFNVRGAAGNYDALWFEGGDDGDFDNVTFRGDGLIIDETINIDLVIQVLRPLSDGTQQLCDQRAQASLGEVWAELSRQATWDKAALGLSNLLRLVVVPATQDWVSGRIDGKPGHLCGAVIGLQVQARWSPTNSL